MTARPPAPDRYATGLAEIAVVMVTIGTVILAALAISHHWPLWETTLTLFVACPATGVAVYAVLGAVNQLAAGRRIRIRWQNWPRRALILADTPRPHCGNCRGDGSITEPYADAEGEYGGEHVYDCPCSTPWRRTLLPLPHRIDQQLTRRAHRKGSRAGYSSEPPF